MTQPQHPPASVLLAEDEPPIAHALCRALEQKGLAVCAVGDGRRALEEVLTLRHRLVLLDLSMPGLTGLEVLEELRRQHVAVPVIVLTNNADPGTREEAMRRGARGFLVKFQTPLAAVVREVLLALGA